MKIHQNVYSAGDWRSPLIPLSNCQLVLLFGDRELASNQALHASIRENYPNAEIIGCTTSGEIAGVELYDQSLCMTAIEFKTTRISVKHGNVNETTLVDLTQQLGGDLEQEDLKYVLVLSDGQKINGTELVESLKKVLPDNVLITGGLAGDGTRFEETIVWHNTTAESGMLVLCGFYGQDVGIAHGTMGGWDPFGPERVVTHSKDNILWTLDDKPALELYKSYLGDHAEGLPSSALLYPLLIKQSDSDESVIRTILNIDESDQSMTFAGDIPEGASVSLMHANFDRLIDGAETAAENALQHVAKHQDTGVVLMISCVGRRLVLNQRVEEEIEAVRDVFGEGWVYTGFYSYGEISPMIDNNKSALHNQTMTITSIFERNA